MANTTLVHPKHQKQPAKKATAKPAAKRRRENHKFGLDVREARHDVTLPILQVDIDEATKVKVDNVNDEENFLSCVVAQAATRVQGAGRVWIGRKTAYLAFPGDGHTLRYEVDAKARDTLERWDRGEHIAEGIEVRLRAPSKKRTRAEMRKTWRKNKHWHKKGTGRTQRESDPLHNIVRNGNLVRWS